MKAIIVGAGRGSRLMPVTQDRPKCLVEVNGKPLLEHVLGALTAVGIDDVVFVGGYRMAKVQERFPGLRYRENTAWQENNILESLMYAAGDLNDDVIVSYSDLVYSAAIPEPLLAVNADIALAVDRDFERKYEGRTAHPLEQAEKVVVEDGSVTRLGKGIDTAAAAGEFIGVARFSKSAAQDLVEHYGRIKDGFMSRPFHEAATIRKAYLTDMLQELAANGRRLDPVFVADEWAEIDTPQDLAAVAEEMKHWSASSARAAAAAAGTYGRNA